MLKEVALAGLETMLNTTLRLDEHWAEKLKPCVGKVLEIEVSPMQWRLRILFMERGLQLVPNLVSAPDAVMQSDIGGYIQLGYLPASQVRQLFQGKIRLTGDVGFAQQVQHLFNHWDVDWEDQASYYVGDIMAHRLANVLREGKRCLGQVQASLLRQITGYVQYERGLVPTAAAMQDFCEEVDALALTVERLEAHIQLMVNA